MYLEELLPRLGKVRAKEGEIPTEELKEDDQLIATLPDGLKALFVLMVRARVRVDRIREEQRKEAQSYGDNVVPDNVLARMEAEYVPAAVEAYLLHSCFWNSARLEYPQIGGNSITVRKDWLLVVVKRQQPACMSGVLVILEGMGGMPG